MAAEKNRAPKMGEAIHLTLTANGTGPRFCAPATVVNPTEFMRDDFRPGEVGDKEYERHVAAHFIEAIYVDPKKSDAGPTRSKKQPHSTDAFNGYHFPEECPYGL